MRGVRPDWLTFRTQAEPGQVAEALGGLFPFGRLKLANLQRGKDGFATGCTVGAWGLDLARLDYGGDSQRGWVRCRVPGASCEFVQDWQLAAGLAELPAAEIRRLDLALTTYEREVTHEAFVAAHAAGRFNCGGRTPNLLQITNSDPMAGRTCGIGARESDKYCRGYEKGLQMAAKYPAGSPLTHVEGYPVEDLYRVEVEFKAKTRPVPWEAAWSPGQYFAGAYPFCAELLPTIEPEVLTPAPKAVAHDLAAMLAHVRTQYGTALFTALTVAEGDIGAVWERIVGKQHHEGLVASGALLLTMDELDSLERH